MTDRTNGPPKEDGAPKGLTDVKGLPHPTYKTSRDQTTGSRDSGAAGRPSWPQESHADLGLVDDGDAAGS